MDTEKNQGFSLNSKNYYKTLVIEVYTICIGIDKLMESNRVFKNITTMQRNSTFNQDKIINQINFLKNFH